MLEAGVTSSQFACSGAHTHTLQGCLCLLASVVHQAATWGGQRQPLGSTHNVVSVHLGRMPHTQDADANEQATMCLLTSAHPCVHAAHPCVQTILPTPCIVPRVATSHSCTTHVSTWKCCVLPGQSRSARRCACPRTPTRLMFAPASQQQHCCKSHKAVEPADVDRMCPQAATAPAAL